MLIPVMVYILILAGLSVGTLFAVDRIIKVGAKGGNADISLNEVFFSGFALTLIVSAVTVTAFTGVATILWVTVLGMVVVMSLVYVWRRARAARDSKMMEEMLSEEERCVMETAQRDPANTAALVRLAELREQRGDYRGAVDFFQKAWELEPTEYNARRLKDLQEIAAPVSEKSNPQG